MQCTYYKEQIASMLTGSLDESQRRELEMHLQSCQECNTEFEASRNIWDLMDEIPTPMPSPSMHSRFNTALNNYTGEFIAEKRLLPAANIFRQRWFQRWYSRPRLQFGYSLLLVAIGLAAGYLLNRQSTAPSATTATTGASGLPIAYNRQIDSLSSQVSEMKQMMMLALLENPSASQRIRAVSYTDEIGATNKKVIDALFTTLNEDPNVNVRLITLEALSKMANDPGVREGLVQSIAQQDSPLVQSAIADVMVKLQEKRSVRPLQKLLSKKDLNEMVKHKIEQSIQKLI